MIFDLRFLIEKRGGGCLPVSDKRRNPAALQDARAIYSGQVGLASAFGRFRRDKQVVEILLEGWFLMGQVFDFPRVADELKKPCVCDWLSSIYSYYCKSLIFRHLPRYSAKFHPFLTRKGVDFPAVTENVPDFYFSQRTRSRRRRESRGRKVRLTA
jgi:hypothetical protein